MSHLGLIVVNGPYRAVVGHWGLAPRPFVLKDNGAWADRIDPTGRVPASRDFEPVRLIPSALGKAQGQRHPIDVEPVRLVQSVGSENLADHQMDCPEAPVDKAKTA